MASKNCKKKCLFCFNQKYVETDRDYNTLGAVSSEITRKEKEPKAKKNTIAKPVMVVFCANTAKNQDLNFYCFYVVNIFRSVCKYLVRISAFLK